MTNPSPDLQKLEEIRLRHRLQLILLHGSRATGKFVHAGSDFDIAVVRQNETPVDQLSLINDLNQIFGDSRIDIVDVTHGNPLLNMAVARHARLLAGLSADLDAFQRKAFFCYGDYVPYLQEESELVKINLHQYVTN